MDSTQLTMYIIYFSILVIFTAMRVVAGYARTVPWVNIVFQSVLWGYSALVALGGVFLTLIYWVNSQSPRSVAQLGDSLDTLLWVGLGALSVGLLSLLIMIPLTRRLIYRLLPANPDSPVHQFGLIFMLPFVAGNIILLLMLTPERILELMRDSKVLSETVTLELFLIALALNGIGWGWERNNKEVLQRLGLQRITPRQIVECAVWAAVLFLMLTAFGEWVVKPYFPETYAFQEELMSTYKLGKELGNPYVEAGIVSIMAGLGEEVFFRGFIQPVLGIIPTAFLFTIIHIQYGLTIGLAIVFTMGAYLGWMRKRVNTTYALTIHFIYDFIAFVASTLNHQG